MGIETILESKTLEDLETTVSIDASNEVDLDDDMITEILSMLASGSSYGDIKSTVKKSGTEFNPSISQIKEIDEARLAKIAELKASE